jgi:hypothetical protein
MAGEGDSGSVTIETFKAFNSFDLFKTSSQSQGMKPVEQRRSPSNKRSDRTIWTREHCSIPPNVSK